MGTTTMDEPAARRALIEACQGMNDLGINQGTSGNISLRLGDTMLISPSAVPYEQMEPEQVAKLPIHRDDRQHEGPLKPSTEWPMHQYILRARPDINAVVHAHPTFATTLAIARRPIPACHYMVAAFGGNDVRCAGYATFGTKELASEALKALDGRNACLLANHGVIVCGPTLAKAMWLAVELETISRQYYHSLLIGGPHLLTDEQIDQTARKFAGYGLQDG